ncbi:MAG: hypothetical protein PUP91_38845, partial [Rhizonema sp. PD37]|nr:hypothetical protein [Rhizonema sp. PD37]
ITQIIEIFRAVLRDKSLTEKLIVQKHLIHGTPYVFKNDEDRYFDLKNQIAHHFSEHFDTVRMVGSAKLGFSISPSKLWQPFSDESDIDIIVSKYS